jgi:hypothetical protein
MDIPTGQTAASVKPGVVALAKAILPARQSSHRLQRLATVPRDLPKPTGFGHGDALVSHLQDPAVRPASRRWGGLTAFESDYRSGEKGDE